MAEATPRVMVRVRSLAMERAANPPLPNPFSDHHPLRSILYQLGLQVPSLPPQKFLHQKIGHET